MRLIVLLLLLVPSQLKVMEFVYVPAGEFMMGCEPQDSECRDNEKPAHRVRIARPFQIQKYEMTQAQWRDVMGSNPSEYEGDELPVHNVSWDNIQEFLQKLNARGDGFRYRLPSEAEWEYAARAGRASAEARDGWTRENSGMEPHRVGTRAANAWGIHDMSGNVWEWVADFFDAKYYAASPPASPLGPSDGKQHVVRGGSFSDVASFARLSNRFGVTTGFGNYDLGFRVVREPEENQGLWPKKDK